MSIKATIANFPPPHYIQRVRSVLERLKRPHYAAPSRQEVEDALESLAEIERHLKQPQP